MMDESELGRRMMLFEQDQIEMGLRQELPKKKPKAGMPRHGVAIIKLLRDGKKRKACDIAFETAIPTQTAANALRKLHQLGYIEKGMSDRTLMLEPKWTYWIG